MHIVIRKPRWCKWCKTLRVTAMLSKSPSFTCYDHDRCEIVEKLLLKTNFQETNILLTNWITAVIREKNGSPNRGLNECDFATMSSHVVFIMIFLAQHISSTSGGHLQ